jgi:hypothetical protein
MPLQAQQPRPGAPAVQPAVAADESGMTRQEIRGYAPGASACRAKLEEEIGSLSAERNIAELIQHQQFLLTEECQEAREFQLVLGDDQVIDQGSHLVEAHSTTLSAGCQGQSGCNVCFTPSIEMPS